MDMDIEVIGPLLECYVEEFFRPHRAFSSSGVVHKDVDAPKMRDRLVHQALEVIPLGDIRLNHQRLATGLLHRLCGCAQTADDVGVIVNRSSTDHDFRAPARQIDRGLPTNSSAGTGYDCHFACQVDFSLPLHGSSSH